MSLSVLRQVVIISRQVEVVIVICIKHIREAVHHIAVLHIAINHIVVLLRVAQATLVQAVVTIVNQIQQISHHIAAAQRKAQRQRRVHMTLMMMGYDDIYMDGDYDYDRYDRDRDYADGVDDAMDEYGEDW